MQATDIDRLAEAVVERMRAERDDRPLLSTEQVAARLGVSERAARYLIERREIASIKIGKSRKVEPKAVDAYVAALRGEEQES